MVKLHLINFILKRSPIVSVRPLPRSLIIMNSSDEDEDMKTAIALSLAESAASQQTKPSPAAPIGTLTQSGMVHLGLDRKKMEEERLARLKRKHDQPELPSEERISKKAPEPAEDLMARKHQFEARDLKISSGSLKYPSGVVKTTWAFGHERTGSDVKLEEVLEPRTLNTAVLSAFQWDTNWVLSKLKIPPSGGNTKCIFVMQGKEVAQREAMLETAKEMRSFLRLCFPPMEGQVNCMHSKLMLLFHPDKLRIAVPTANLVDYDWGESGLMENSVFMIDLPRLPNGAKNQASDLTSFGKELLFFLEKQGIGADVIAGILNFDFQATSRLAFIHTVGGTSLDNDARRTGLAGLSSAVSALNLSTQTLEIDYAASSIGSLNDTFLTNVHSAARGEDPVATITAAASTARSNFFTPVSSRQNNSSTPVAVRDCMRIYFPTRDTVLSSAARGAGTICLQRNWFEGANFPRSCFRDYRSTRKGLLSHNKILCARGKQDTSSQKVKDVAWLYVGSANMSESAWGKVTSNKKKGEMKISCRNWECGVLLPVEDDVLLKNRKGSGGDEGLNGELVSMDVFKSVIDLPFKVPGERYGSKEPWYFREQM